MPPRVSKRKRSESAQLQRESGASPPDPDHTGSPGLEREAKKDGGDEPSRKRTLRSASKPTKAPVEEARPNVKPQAKPAKTTAKTKAKKSTPAQKASKESEEKPGTSDAEPSKPVKKALDTVKTSKPAKKSAAAPAASKSSQIEREGGETCYWLLKAEPESRFERGVDVKFSIDDLAACTEPEAWDGVRNPMAQKNMRSMRAGELAFFYHSNCKVPGVAGVMQIVREQSTDESAFDPQHPYYDAKSDRAKPRWCVVHVRFVMKFDELVPLKKLQEFFKSGEPLETLQVLKMARLSVSRVMPAEWDFVLGLADVRQSQVDEALGKLGGY